MNIRYELDLRVNAQTNANRNTYMYVPNCKTENSLHTVPQKSLVPNAPKPKQSMMLREEPIYGHILAKHRITHQIELETFRDDLSWTLPDTFLIHCPITEKISSLQFLSCFHEVMSVHI